MVMGKTEMDELLESRSPIFTEDLRILCIQEDWFTNGDNSQYEKLFQLNREGASLEELALVIWICSDDWTCEEILSVLRKRFDHKGHDGKNKMDSEEQ